LGAGTHSGLARLFQAYGHFIGNGQASGQPRRFYAKQIHQPGHAMLDRAINAKITEFAVWPGQFWPNTGIGRL